MTSSSLGFGAFLCKSQSFSLLLTKMRPMKGKFHILRLLLSLFLCPPSLICLLKPIIYLSSTENNNIEKSMDWTMRPMRASRPFKHMNGYLLGRNIEILGLWHFLLWDIFWGQKFNVPFFGTNFNIKICSHYH